ncbi:helix-turn-helix domain-containing protein [Rhizobium sp. BR 317]|uniref:helix-turn-helix domain-containing protein n=1 Tax=Rhizobium sp. BR 317 TaxID=3040015 RepID=UPI0039BF38B4
MFFVFYQRPPSHEAYSPTMQTSSISIFNFSTLAFPEKDRFHAWVRDNHCDCRLRNDSPVAFNAEATGATLGPLIISGRKWLNQGRAPAYEIRRTERLARTDGHDFFRFSLMLRGRLICWSTDQSPTKSAGDLFVVDAAQINECLVEADDTISLLVPRHLLPGRTELLHGHTLSGGMASLLGDHMISLYRNLSNLKQQDIPYIVQSTMQLVTAAVSSAPDVAPEAGNAARDLLLGRIRRYIDGHLLEADLTPDRICRDVGVSRAKLYQLFENDGGVMRQIQRRRLWRAHHTLADPNHARRHIAEIAWSHGFSNEKYFYRLFKAEFGHTPKETLENMLGRSLRLEQGVPHSHQQETNSPAGWTLPFGVPS